MRLKNAGLALLLVAVALPMAVQVFAQGEGFRAKPRHTHHLRQARREVVVVADGIDPNNPSFDANDPYVQAAISDSVRAGLVVYSVYWRGRDHADVDASAVNGGQSLLNEVTQATGGVSYSSGTGNPVSFQPFLADLMLRLANQYELDFSARLDRKPMVETMKTKVEALSLQVLSPDQVFIDKPAGQ